MYCTEGHDLIGGMDYCVHGHHAAAEPQAELTPTPERGEEPDGSMSEQSAEQSQEEITEYKEDHMGDNYSVPTIQGFPFSGGYSHRDHDGLEGKDAVLIHALHDSKGHGDSLREVLHSKFDVATHLGDKLHKVEHHLEDKFCKIGDKLERIEDRVEKFERHRLDRVIKEQDDKIQELKMRLLILSGGVLPTATASAA